MSSDLAYIITPDGVSGVYKNLPFNFSASHINYNSLMSCITTRNMDNFNSLLYPTNTVKAKLSKSISEIKVGEYTVTVTSDCVMVNGVKLQDSIVKRILDTINKGLDCKNLVYFLINTMSLPSSLANDIYTWCEHSKLPITDDGYILAWKRVNDNYRSFYDNKTEHKIGFPVSIPRRMCDDNRNNTCSTGLHFCSQTYLNTYHGGQGKILLLKIHPADIVSIPVEYKNEKGRACRYIVLAEVSDKDILTKLESNSETPDLVLDQPVISTAEAINSVKEYSDEFYEGYNIGYKDGRHATISVVKTSKEFSQGYNYGYIDGKRHARKYTSL